jgi:hypothetical protein
MRKGLVVATVAALISVFVLNVMSAPNKMPAETKNGMSVYDLQAVYPNLNKLPVELTAQP